MNGRTGRFERGNFLTGCLVTLGVIVVVLGILIFLGYQWGRDVTEAQRDPVLRDQHTRAVLGAETLPDGYMPMVGVSVPLIVDVAILSDREPDTKGEIDGFDERGFLYLRFKWVGPKADKVTDFLEGRTDEIEGMDDLDLERSELVSRGHLDLDGLALLYAVYRGDIEIDQSQGEGLVALVQPECKNTRRARLAIWFGPDPAPQTPVNELELAGTVGDEEAMLEFLRHFNLCGT